MVFSEYRANSPESNNATERKESGQNTDNTSTSHSPRHAGWSINVCWAKGWPSGKALGWSADDVGSISRFGASLSWIVAYCSETLALTMNETLKWLSSLPILMQKSLWWGQSSVRHSSTLPHLESWDLCPASISPQTTGREMSLTDDGTKQTQG